MGAFPLDVLSVFVFLVLRLADPRFQFQFSPPRDGNPAILARTTVQPGDFICRCSTRNLTPAFRMQTTDGTDRLIIGELTQYSAPKSTSGSEILVLLPVMQRPTPLLIAMSRVERHLATVLV